MIPKPIKEIDVAALNALIENEVSEGKTIEYKRELRGLFDKTDKKLADKHVESFLATVSAFANTAGGDLLIGVEEDNGVPTGLPGIEINDPDKERLRLGQILRDNLEPRLPHVDIESIRLSNGRYVLVIRAPKSWNSPHRVNKNNRFYARHSAQSVPLDVGELRSAFTLSEAVADRIRNFRTDRIIKIQGRGTPVPLDPGGCMVLHIIPLSAFTEGAMIDIAAYKNSPNILPPIGEMRRSAVDSRINLDGIVTFEEYGGRLNRTYTQLFRTGVVESVGLLLAYKNHSLLFSDEYQQKVISFLEKHFKFVVEFNLEMPYYIFLSFVGVRESHFAIDTRTLGKRRMEWHSRVQEPEWEPHLRTISFNEDVLILPEVVIEDRDAQPQQLLRPIFDMVWNAFGFIRSPNYDEQGNWIDQR